LLYLWCVRPPGLLLRDFSFQHDGLRIQRPDRRVGLEADVVPVVRQDLHGVLRRVQAVLGTQRHQQVHHGLTGNTPFIHVVAVTYYLPSLEREIHHSAFLLQVASLLIKGVVSCP